MMFIDMIRFYLVSLFFLSFGLSVNALDQVVASVHGSTVILKWKTLIQDQAVLFSVSIRNGENLDWLAIGFSDHGAYNNSDICLFRNGVLRDYYVDGSFHMELDRGQDCELTRKTKDGFEFRRRFNTCDNKDYAIEPGTTQFIIAGCYEFTNKFDSPTVDKALHYGKLIDSNEQVVQMENDRTQFTVLADKAKIPAQITTYWCVVKEIPRQFQNVKHHIIKMNAVVEPGNEHIVHHMETFQCQTDDQTEFSGDCNSPNKPRQSKSCSHVMAAWAMGEGVFYPSETGLPMGGANSKRFVMVEIHYNNVMKMAGVIDNSGFEFTATPSLRRYDAAIMELGLIYSDANSIPPGQKSFPITGHCVADCTDKLPPSGIFVFGSQLHAHLTGRKLFTSHYRNGKHYCKTFYYIFTLTILKHIKLLIYHGTGDLGTPVFYPSETGLPLGGANSKRFVMVEIHYNNVIKMAGVIDNSGFEFTATPSLRRYDAAIMELGIIYSDANSIPPGQKSFPITGHCVADCTEKLPPSGIFVFVSQLHAHLTGRKLFTSHYRNGVKIGEINRDNHYSPHWQHLQDVRPYVNVKQKSITDSGRETHNLISDLFSGSTNTINMNFLLETL